MVPDRWTGRRSGASFANPCPFRKSYPDVLVVQPGQDRDGNNDTEPLDGFDSDDNPHQPGVMLADVLDQLGLGIGWPRNENRAGVCDRLSDSLKEGVILRGVPAPDGVCLMVDVLGR